MRAVVFAYSNVGDRCLRVLHAHGLEVALVVTHPDPAGETLWYRRVADTAVELGLPLRLLGDAADPALHAEVAALQPDFIFSFYCRAMLPMELLALARRGAFNMHGSLLPQFRGRAPTNWAVLMGASQTGATLHEMTAKPDAGLIVDQQAVPILPDDTAQEVFDKVTVAAETVLWRSLDGLRAGTAPRLPNDLSQGRYFGGRRPEDGRIDWSRPAAEVYNLVRAVAPPYPGAFTDVGEHRVVLARARRLAASQAVPLAGLRAGLNWHQGRVLALCGDAGLLHVQQLMLRGQVLDKAAAQALLSNPSEETEP